MIGIVFMLIAMAVILVTVLRPRRPVPRVYVNEIAVAVRPLFVFGGLLLGILMLFIAARAAFGD